MKKSLLIAALTFCCTSAYSQLKIYPKVGMVVSSQNLVFREGHDRENRDIHNRMGMQVGVGVEKLLSQKIALSADLLYAQLGYIDRLKVETWKIEEYVYKLNYFISPVSVKYYVTNLPTQQFFLAGGVYGGVFLNGKRTPYTYGPAVSYSSELEFGVDEKYDYDMLDWGIQFGAGMHFNISKSEFVANASYALGMSEVHENYFEGYARGGSYKGGNGKNKFFYVNFGYVLPIWKSK